MRKRVFAALDRRTTTPISSGPVSSAVGRYEGAAAPTHISCPRRAKESDKRVAIIADGAASGAKWAVRSAIRNLAPESDDGQAVAATSALRYADMVRARPSSNGTIARKPNARSARVTSRARRG